MNGFMAARRFVKPLLFAAIPVAAIAALVAFWNWNWFIPIVQGRASSALGRAVTIEHLHVQLGRVTMVSADGVRIANPADVPEQGDRQDRAAERAGRRDGLYPKFAYVYPHATSGALRRYFATSKIRRQSRLTLTGWQSWRQ
jgi:hypothetical protein